nr:exonuclease [bacterium]
MPKQGHLSGSRFKDMMTRGRGTEFGKTCTNLAIMIAGERLGLIKEWDDYSNSYMDWGNEQEEHSITAYEREYLREVHSSQVWQQHPEYEWVGCTPDGLIGEDGVYETKSPKTENHILNWIQNEQLDQYKYQVHGSLWVTGRDWCDFASYDPRVREDIQLHVIRVRRDEKLIKEIDQRYQVFEKLVGEWMDKIRTTYKKVNGQDL